MFFVSIYKFSGMVIFIF